MVSCPRCRGKGTTWTIVSPPTKLVYLECLLCHREKHTTQEEAGRYNRGILVHVERVMKGVGVEEVASDLNSSPEQVLTVESGIPDEMSTGEFDRLLGELESNLGMKPGLGSTPRTR